MLKDIINEIENIKQALYNKIKSLPQNENITIINKQPRCFTVMFKEIIGNPLSSYYYDFQAQYKMIVEHLNNTRIENFEKTLQTIIDTSKITIQKHTYNLNPKVVQYLDKLVNGSTLPEMEATKIKEANLQKIIALANNDTENCLQGTQLEALYNLIQKKGDTIRSKNKKLNGLKCIKLPNNKYLAIKHIPYGNSFYPCMTRTFLMEEVLTD